MKRLVKTIILMLVFVSLTTTSVSAQSTSGLCAIFPCNGLESVNLGGLLRFGFSMIFTVMIIIGIISVIKGATKIIQSEGNAKEIEAGSNIIKSVVIGISVIFIGVIGIVLIFTVFNAQSAFNQPVNLPGGVKVDPDIFK